MKKAKTKHLLIILILIVVIVITAAFFFYFHYNPQPNLEVSFLDVGQGDALFIKTPYNQNILIDGGPDNKIIKRLSENMPFYDRVIDLMILTHPHDDHVNGLNDVVERYKIGKILLAGVKHYSPGYLHFLDLIKKYKIPTYFIENPEEINLGENCVLNIIYPIDSFKEKTQENLNNSSIVSILDCADHRFLLTGDAEHEVENFLLEKNIDLRADVLKLGHHGSDTSTGKEFLGAVNPETAIIQVGKDNNFEHPSMRTLFLLERKNVSIKRNDLEGTIRLIY